ncbi:MAG: acetyl/propionyl/methylcrotonyl-CoA carboxylase subunit alpha [Acidimicrobiales bacterium]|nr:acetyl/propionyl/methylcrotonyl-CoA carboxylase subunit alpha [Hyphomonadaceae bacterium]RZV42902.1 MAG: acetyl/propionyl/methylcrotonyl-CoA carboxylase subunit alpha [Acidimicrobiales bacterium]
MSDTIKKILIANRGEIACRVIKTARKMGIQTVAVYSDADKKALHVRMADEAVHIGASPAAESYLVIDKIIEACKQTKADAVHPGYGFLSENPEFARRLKKEKIVFIGPAPESMEAMGLKDAAKKLMEKAGVPVTPGYHSKDQDVKTLKTESTKIGYPVLIKAVAGGGGKGMRKVEAEKDFEDMLASCQREAKSSFGDDRVLIEKYILSPRHIEVQVFGDTHGNVVHMFERDCSLQRRHQKVIEEAPAPGMTDEVRKAMTDAAVKAAQAVDYVGAGTVEFIVDGSGKLCTDGFWFMEMNTRLQVEHPVTELITGLDLVELQIRVAQGEKLPKQKDIKMQGHAVEARLYAEDPANDFLPSIGKLDILSLPDNCRIDTGVEEGGEVSLFYDPMIAKIISLESSRELAIQSLASACKNSHIYPVKSNPRFLLSCVTHNAFLKGDVSTNFIAEHLNPELNGSSLEFDKPAIAHALKPTAGSSVFSKIDGWRLNQPAQTKFKRSHAGESLFLEIDPAISNSSKLTRRYRRPEGDVVFVDGLAYLIRNGEGLAGEIAAGDNITAPMPGKILDVRVKVGDSVIKGDKLIVMEAMKMEMSLEAPRDGVIEVIDCAVDDLVDDGAVLLTLETEE